MDGGNLVASFRCRVCADGGVITDRGFHSVSSWHQALDASSVQSGFSGFELGNFLVSSFRFALAYSGVISGMLSLGLAKLSYVYA